MYTAKFTFSHANYIYNRMIHPQLNNTMCPFEFATGIKPDLSKLRMNGFIACACIDPSRRTGKLAEPNLTLMLGMTTSQTAI